MTAQATVDAVRIMQSVTIEVKVKHLKQAKLRIWAGCQLLELAARVMNCNIEVVTAELESESNDRKPEPAAI